MTAPKLISLKYKITIFFYHNFNKNKLKFTPVIINMPN